MLHLINHFSHDLHLPYCQSMDTGSHAASVQSNFFFQENAFDKNFCDPSHAPLLFKT